jgi:transglutaminase-like putative cysteine protease
MRAKVKNICPNCNHIELEKKTIIKTLLKIPHGVFIGLLLSTSILGTLALYNFIQEGIYENPNMLISIGGTWATSYNVLSMLQDKNDFRELAKNITKECTDNYCKTKKLYDYMTEEFNYDWGEEALFPKKILQEKEGDCDELSYLYMTLLKSLNINARLSCSATHCWSIIKLEDKLIMADITQYQWEEYGR